MLLAVEEISIWASPCIVEINCLEGVKNRWVVSKPALMNYIRDLDLRCRWQWKINRFYTNLLELENALHRYSCL